MIIIENETKFYKNALGGDSIQEKHWWFTVMSRNGRTLSTSETYTSKQMCFQGIASMIRNATPTVNTVYVHEENEKKKMFWQNWIRYRLNVLSGNATKISLEQFLFKSFKF